MKPTRLQRLAKRARYWIADNEPVLWLVGYSVFVYVVMVVR